MEKGKTRQPTCARCRNHGNPNVLIKNHGNVCPWKKDHGPECKLGCALIIERHKVNEEIKKNVRSKNSGKRNHTGNRKKDEAKVAKTMSSSTAAKRESNRKCFAFSSFLKLNVKFCWSNVGIIDDFIINGIVSISHDELQTSYRFYR